MRVVGLTTIGLIAAVVALTLGVGAASGGEQAKATKDVTIQGTITAGYFDPKDVTVHKGDRVKWTWNDTKSHNVYLNKGPRGVDKSDFRSPTYNEVGKTWAKGFRKPGDYKFICLQHSAVMRMTVEVKR